MEVNAKDKEILFLKDNVYQLEIQVSRTLESSIQHPALAHLLDTLAHSSLTRIQHLTW